MGSVADCFDDALAESVFATLECELSDQQPGGRFTTRREVELAVFDYLETSSTCEEGRDVGPVVAGDDDLVAQVDQGAGGWAPIMPSPPVTRITGPPRSAGG